VQLAKRTGILEQGDKGFFPHALPSVMERYKSCHAKLFNTIRQLVVSAPATVAEKFGNNIESTKLFPEDYGTTVVTALNKVVVFGELFGGYLPGAAKDPTVTGHPIQKGIYYCPYFDFYAFDTYIECTKQVTKKQSPEQQGASAEQDVIENVTFGYWLPHIANEKLWPESGFTVYARAVAKGTLPELLQYNVEAPTTIPQAFYKHLLINSNNNEDQQTSQQEQQQQQQTKTNKKKAESTEPSSMEGVVIKPYRRNIYVKRERVVIKKKSEAFAEVIKSPTQKQRQAKQPKFDDIQLKFETAESNEAFDLMKRYLTVPRIESCASKIGEVNYKNMGDLIKLYVKDVFSDFEKENEALWNKVPDNDRKVIHKKISYKAPDVVKDWLKENNKF